jgi:hypothetical protein
VEKGREKEPFLIQSAQARFGGRKCKGYAIRVNIAIPLEDV